MNGTGSSTHRRLPARSLVAVYVASAINGLSRMLGRGSGAVIGGRAGLVADPTLLTVLSQHRHVALVTGTNGKTTTTGMLVAALTDGECAPVATNTTGANMPAGHVSALAGSRAAGTVVLEVDEVYLGQLIEEARPEVVVLLNLSRDQLDRISEVRMLVDRWRDALGGTGRIGGGHHPVVVANADDPMVAWAAMAAPDVRWVGAGQVWHEDSVGCPACGGRIIFEGSGAWHCSHCEFSRPDRLAWVERDVLVLSDGRRFPLAIGLPGQFNRANAAMVAIAAPAMRGPACPHPVTISTALDRLGTLSEVAGRFSLVRRENTEVRLLLAKNPAGWTAIFDLLDEMGGLASPVVVSVNARVADGLDTSWLWDVTFERLAGRTVLAAGERCHDLAVRLRYAGVGYRVIPDPLIAVETAAGSAGAQSAGSGPIVSVDFLGNYTAFAELRKRL
ncbi:MAG: MurT ligase domain-containing protein [Acidimicrobiales bacterium]